MLGGFAWSWMLLVCSEPAPTIHLSLKFLKLCILSLHLQQTEHRNATTIFLPEFKAVTQSSQVIDYILSKSLCTFCVKLYALILITLFFFIFIGVFYFSVVIAQVGMFTFHNYYSDVYMEIF